MNHRCPITYEPIKSRQLYSTKGIKLISRTLTHLDLFPYSPEQQIEMALKLATKMSIQGIQPKLSIKLNHKNNRFEVVDTGGRYILKPPHANYQELPANEDLTMRLANIVGIEVPFHCLIYNIDHSLSYLIKRFDRVKHTSKLAVEDFSQLMGFDRETKYESSMEKIVTVLEKHCTFPIIEKQRLFRLVVFNFLVGNEDMHLKNFMLIRHPHRTQLSPAYDLLNTSVVLNATEEIALPLRGKKSRLTREDFIDYYGIERLGLEPDVINRELEHFKACFSLWEKTINNSFLSPNMAKAYLELVEQRKNRLNF